MIILFSMSLTSLIVCLSALTGTFLCREGSEHSAERILRDTRPQTKMQRLDWSLSRKVTQDIKTQPQINHYHQTPSASPRHDPPCSTCFPTHPPSLGHMTRFTLSHHYAERMRPWRRTVRTRAWAEWGDRWTQPRNRRNRGWGRVAPSSLTHFRSVTSFFGSERCVVSEGAGGK